MSEACRCSGSTASPGEVVLPGSLNFLPIRLEYGGESVAPASPASQSGRDNTAKLENACG